MAASSFPVIYMNSEHRSFGAGGFEGDDQLVLTFKGPEEGAPLGAIFKFKIDPLKAFTLTTTTYPEGNPRESEPMTWVKAN